MGRTTAAALVIVLVIGALSAIYLPGIIYPKKTNTVHVYLKTGNYFSPKTVTVVIGVNNTVQWTDQDPSLPHSVTEGDHTNITATPLFNSGIMHPGENFTYTFTKPGTYQYYCSPHIFDMFGWVLVKS